MEALAHGTKPVLSKQEVERRPWLMVPNPSAFNRKQSEDLGQQHQATPSLGAAGQSPSSHRCRGSAPGPASSRLRPPSREARSTFRRKRVRTLGGSVGLCCHGPLTFEGQGGVTGNTTWAVGVRKPRACCQTQRQIPPCERASRRPVASDQWPVTSGRRAGRWFPACPARSTSHTFTAVCPRRSPRPLPVRTEDCSCLGTVTLDCLSCRLPLKALALTPCWGNV